MRDFMIALILLALLVVAFSTIPVEADTKTANSSGMYLSLSGDVSSLGEIPNDVGPDGDIPIETPGQEAKEETTPTNPLETPEPSSKPTKTIDELALEVIIGLWENGEERQQLLANAGYDYEAVQTRVNELLGHI